MKLAARDALIIFYDDDCATCSAVVRFVTARKRRNSFRFVSLNTLVASPYKPAVEQWFQQNQIGQSILVLRNGNLLSKTSAVFAIILQLGFPWALLCAFWIVPAFIRNALYDLYAFNRYRIAGRVKTKACELIAPELRPLFWHTMPEDLTIFKPRDGIFLEAQWRNLVMFNFEIPQHELKPFLPKGVEFDDWQGKTFCSLIGFNFTDTGVFNTRIPGHVDFIELNLRFYVRKLHINEKNETSYIRGVVFIKELVPKPAIALVARVVYNEPYESKPMRYSLDETGPQSAKICYYWESEGSKNTLSAEVYNAPSPLEKGSLEEFITEHYFGYVAQRDGSTIEYEVEHPRWRVWHPTQFELQGDFKKTYDDKLAKYLTKPHSVIVAEGSPIRVFRGKKIRSR